MIAVMCVTIVGKVLEANGKAGLVEVNGEKQEMNLGLVKAKKGDYVSCAAGLAVERLDKAEALAIIKARRDAFEKK